MSMNSRVGHIPEYFGSMVFNDAVMKERLPKEAYRAPVSYTQLDVYKRQGDAGRSDPWRRTGSVP